MSVLTDPIVLPPFQIGMFILGFLVNKIIDRKSGKNLTDLERLNYLSDGLVNHGVMYGKKIKGTAKSIMSDEDELPSKTIPRIKELQREILEEVDSISIDSGLIMSEMQLEINMMKDDLLKHVEGLTFNNGEFKKEEEEVL